MLILDTTTLLNQGTLDVPSYHKGHLSLKSGTEVTTCLLPDPRRRDSPFPSLSEVVITPIIFDSWRYLTRVSGTFHDKPGIVRKLANVLKFGDVDILYDESASVESRRFHRAEMLVDLRNQYERFERGNADDSDVLPALERRIQSICLNELILDGHRPRLKVRKMEGLRNAWEHFTHRPNADALARTSVVKSKLQLPPSILAQITQQEPSRAILVSDTKERLLRLLFPHEDIHFTYIRVGHNDSIGAFAEITDALAFAFDAILTLNRLKTQSKRNDVELLLYSPEMPKADDDQARREIAESLLAVPAFKHLDIEVSYPSQSGAIGPAPQPPRSVRKPPAKPLRALVPLEPELQTKSTSSILRSRITKYRKQLEKETDPGVTDSVRRRLYAAKHLLAREGDGPLPTPRIFISYDFTHDVLHNVLSEQLQKKKCDLSDGRNAFDGERFRDVIKRRIKASSGFIAIWRAREDHGFSPWLLWELGVAQAADIPYCLFVHENLEDSPHIRINPEKHHVTFNDTLFENAVAERLPSFLGEVSRFERAQLRKRSLEELALEEA